MKLRYTFITQIVYFSTFKQPCLDKWLKIRNKPQEIIIVIGHFKTDHGLCGHNKA